MNNSLLVLEFGFLASMGWGQGQEEDRGYALHA
jgi:hypothetical protein